MTIFYRLHHHGQPIDEGKTATTLTVGAGAEAQVRFPDLDADDVVLVITEIGGGELHVRAAGWCDGLRVGARAMRPDGEFTNPVDLTLSATLGDYRLEVREGGRDPMWGEPAADTASSQSPLLTSDVAIRSLPKPARRKAASGGSSREELRERGTAVSGTDSELQGLAGAIPEGAPLLDEDDPGGGAAEALPSFEEVQAEESGRSGPPSDIELSVLPAPKSRKSPRPTGPPIPPPVPEDSDDETAVPPPASPSRLDVVEREESGEQAPIAYLELSGSLDASTTDAFLQAMERQRRHGYQWILLDFGGVQFVNSSGLGTLVRLVEQFEKAGAIVLVNVPHKVRSTFELLGLQTLLAIHERTDDALEDIRRRQRKQADDVRKQDEARRTQELGLDADEEEPEATKIALEDTSLQNLVVEEETIDTGAEEEDEPEEEGEDHFDEIRPTQRARRVAPPLGEDRGAEEADEEEEIAPADEPEPLDDDDSVERAPSAEGQRDDSSRLGSYSGSTASRSGAGRASDAPGARSRTGAAPPPPPAPAPTAAPRREAPPEPEPTAPRGDDSVGSAPPPAPTPAGRAADPEPSTRSLPVPELKRKAKRTTKPEKKEAAPPEKQAASQSQHKAKALPAGSTLERKTTVRYYSRMNPDRNFPLLVVLSRPDLKLDKPRQARVAQKEGTQPFAIHQGNPVVTVVPRFPGCLVVPDKLHVDVTPDHVEFPFWVTPQAVGELRDARVEVWYEGRCIDTIKCPTSCRRQTGARVAATLGVIAPVFFSTFEATTGMSVQEQTRSLLQVNVPQIAEQLGGFTNLGLYAGGTLIAGALLAWLLARPKRSATPAESFFDFTLQERKKQ